jgi:hypothetical protein
VTYGKLVCCDVARHGVGGVQAAVGEVLAEVAGVARKALRRTLLT